MDEPVKPSKTTCRLCGGSKIMGQRGIFLAYLWPFKVSLLLMGAGIVLAVVRDPRWLALSAAAYLLPVVGADLRTMVYPIVALGHLFGKKANCPKCSPSGKLFRE